MMVRRGGQGAGSTLVSSAHFVGYRAFLLAELLSNNIMYNIILHHLG